MRTMLKFRIPVEAGNRAFEEGKIGEIIGSVMNALEPEAAYFLAEGGQRTGLIFFDLKEVSDIPGITEPLFSNLEAEVTLVPVMNAEDLQAGVGKATGRA